MKVKVCSDLTVISRSQLFRSASSLSASADFARTETRKFMEPENSPSCYPSSRGRELGHPISRSTSFCGDLGHPSQTIRPPAPILFAHRYNACLY